MLDYKTATENQLEAEFLRLSRLVNDTPYATKKEFFHLPRILAVGEQPLAVASGTMEGGTWLIVLTERRVILLDKGMFWGLKQVDVNINDIVSVGGNTGIMFGEILIGTAGQNYTIRNVFKSVVTPFTNLVNETRDKKKAESTSTASPASDNDTVSQLERLAALRDKGVLNEEEFIVQKAKILNG